MKLWICNRKRCERCYEECKHTTERKYALYPDQDKFTTDTNGNEWQWITQAEDG